MRPIDPSSRTACQTASDGYLTFHSKFSTARRRPGKRAQHLQILLGRRGDPLSRGDVDAHDLAVGIKFGGERETRARELAAVTRVVDEALEAERQWEPDGDRRDGEEEVPPRVCRAVHGMNVEHRFPVRGGPLPTGTAASHDCRPDSGVVRVRTVNARRDAAPND